MNVSHPPQLFSVDLLATGIGDLVAIRSRRLYLTPAQAIHMGRLMIEAAERIQGGQVRDLTSVPACDFSFSGLEDVV